MAASTRSATTDALRLRVPAGETIFREGSLGGCAYVIGSGLVEILVSRNGGEMLLARRGPGEVLGEMAMIDERPRSATARAVEDCELIRISREQIHNRIRNTDPVLRMCLGVILRRFRATLEDLESVRGMSDPGGHAIKSETDPSYDLAIHEIFLERELNDALRDEELLLYFQPVVDLRSGAIAGFESLVRWNHREHGLMPPADFLPTAEACGIMGQIGRWAFRRSCDFLSRLRRSRLAEKLNWDPFIAVNVSGSDLTEPDFVSAMIAIAHESEIPASRVKLEITEGALLSDPTLAADVLGRLKEHGFCISIDDFGTGYSSLSYLHKFPFDTLKIDKSFVQSMGESRKVQRLVQSIVALAKELELEVVAEGIETDDQAQSCCGLDCGFGQGFLYSRPIPEASIPALVEQWSRR